MNNHYTFIRMTKIKNTYNTKFWQGCRKTGTYRHC